MGAALDSRSDLFRTSVSLALWVLWVATLLATLVPRTSTLTVVRVLVPASVGAAVWAAAATAEPGWTDALAIASTGVAAIVALAPATGERFVNGSAYGAERRFPLRAPGLVLLGLVEIVWAAVVAGAVTGPLLVVAGEPLWGLLAAVIGWPIAYAGSRSLHRLAQRWLVFVPAGLALVDPLALTDSISMPRAAIAGIGPAPADTTAIDLTAGALGLALQVRFDAPLTIGPLAGSGAPAVDVVEADQVLFTPTRPGAVLREAAARSLPVT
jgi:hypothetical protein